MWFKSISLPLQVFRPYSVVFLALGMFYFCEIPCKHLQNKNFPPSCCFHFANHGLLRIVHGWEANQNSGFVIVPTSVPGPSRWDGDEDLGKIGKIRFIVPKFWGKNRMRSATQPYCNDGWIRLCLTAHAIFSPKFWNDKTNFTRVFVTVSPRRPWDRGCNSPWVVAL